MVAAASLHAARDRAPRLPRLRSLSSGTQPSWAWALWFLAALLLWLAAGTIDRTTEVEVFSDGDRIHVHVAGSEIAAPVAIESLDAIEIRAADSIDPPGGGYLVISTNDTTLLDEMLPRRFTLPPGDFVPVGDWDIDERAGEGVVWQRRLVVRGPFTIRALFRGRMLRDLSLVLRGRPTTCIGFRRGLINNDIFIRDDEGFVLASTSIDPTPAADVGAALALLLRAAALGGALVGVFCLLGSGFPQRPHPSATLRRWSPPWIAVALAVAAFLLSAWVAGSVLQKLPHQPDSVVYLLQAKWLLHGALWGNASPDQNPLALPYTYLVGNRLLAQYPPGWPFVLALGLAMGSPWMVAPMLGGIFIVLLYLAGRELDGPELGLGAAALGLVSPEARILFASMLSHAAGATLLVAGLWLILVARRRANPFAAAVAGAAMGALFGIRPLTAVAAAAPIAALLARDVFVQRDRHSAVRRLLAAAAGGLATATPTLIANHLITGHAFAFPYTLARRSMYLLENIPFGLRNMDALLASTGSAIFGWGWDLAHGPFLLALALAFACVPFLLRRARAGDWLLLAITATVVLAYLGTRGHGLHGYGPRYYFEIFPCLYLLTARGFQELARMGAGEDFARKRLPVAAALTLFLILNLSALAELPHRLALYRGYNGVDSALEGQVAAIAPRRALILFADEDWQGWAMASRLMETRSQGDIVFAMGTPDNPDIRRLAGDREILLWRDGRLIPAGED